MNININSSATDITQVTVDGNTDIQKVNVDGTDVWFKGPTAIETMASLYTNWRQHIRGDYGGGQCGQPENDRDISRNNGHSCAPYKSGNHTSTWSYSFSLSAPLDTSPNNTFIALQVGHNNPPDITTMKVNGSSITEVDSHNVDVNAPMGNRSSDLAIAVGYTTTNIESITSTSAYMKGGDPSGYAMVGDYSIVIPGKWAIKTKDTGTFSGTLLPGEFVIFNNGIGGETSTLPSSQITSTATKVMERNGHWYNTTLWGLWCNDTSSNKTFSHSQTNATTTVFEYVSV